MPEKPCFECCRGHHDACWGICLCFVCCADDKEDRIDIVVPIPPGGIR